ncbi:sulfotransferase family protein [Halomonas sp. HG01]|uniref:sulfotransferase family protein n=1 Tax=Halomonas sp. HG01 TaxID=1609967 RepID=UPI0009E40D25|nr:sulfotransferase [Halomonas sp. HG01]
MKKKPVFIIGAGRSGTKFLRDILAASPEVVRVPYDIGYLWRYGNEGLNHDEIDPDSVSRKSIRWMRKKLPKLIDRSVYKPDASILVEKSVPNALRPRLLYRAFPEATFVHLVRDGRAVTESAMRMWRTPPERHYLMDKIRYFPWGNIRYAIWYVCNRAFGKVKNSPAVWGPRYRGIENDIQYESLHVVCAKQWFHCVRVASEQLATIPQDQVVSVRYEDIMVGTESLTTLCEKLGIDPDPVVRRHEEMLRPGENEKWRRSLTPEQINDIHSVFKALPESIKDWVFSEKAS